MIPAIGPTAQLQAGYPNANVYDGLGKAIFPGLRNYHAHLSAAIERGLNLTCGPQNSLTPPVSPNSELLPDERVLISETAIIEAMKTGTTTSIENVCGIAREAKVLADTGRRCVFAESFNNREGAAVMSAELLAKNRAPTYSAKLRDEGMSRIAELHTACSRSRSSPGTTFSDRASSPRPGLAATRRFITVSQTSQVPRMDSYFC